MIDSFTIEDPGFPWYGWWWTGGSIGALLIIGLVFWILSYSGSTRTITERFRTVTEVALTIAIIAIPLGAAVNGIVSTVLRSNEINTQMIAEMEELGYHSPSFSGSGTEVFTAIQDDNYVLGTIVEDPALTWRLVIIDTNKETE